MLTRKYPAALKNLWNQQEYIIATVSKANKPNWSPGNQGLAAIVTSKASGESTFNFWEIVFKKG